MVGDGMNVQAGTLNNVVRQMRLEPPQVLLRRFHDPATRISAGSTGGWGWKPVRGVLAGAHRLTSLVLWGRS